MNRDDLITSHLPLAKHVVRRYAYGLRNPDVHADALSDAYVALCQAADMYDPSVGSFAPYAYVAMKRHVIAMRRRALVHFAETTVFNGAKDRYDEEFPGGDMDRLEVYAGVTAPSAEQLLLEAEQQAIGQARLARLDPESRARATAYLADEVTMGGGLKPGTAVTLARLAGVRIPRVAQPVRKRMSGAERQARYYARKKNEVYARKRARMAAEAA